MRKILTILKNFTLLEKGLLLCFLLPPAGIGLLILIGLHTLYQEWWTKRRFYYSLSSYFFLCLFLSTVGAVIFEREITFLVISVMILGYWGLYIRILDCEKNKLFHKFRLIMIFGGIYSCIIGWISKLVIFPVVLSYLTGTILFGQVEPKNFNRLIGCAYNPNFTVFILLTAIAFLFAIILSSLKSRKYKLLLWQLPSLYLLSFGVFQTGSRAGFMTMLLVYLLFIFRLNRKFFIFSLIIGLSISKLLINVMPRADSIMQASQIRFDIWKNAFNIWKEHPFFGVTPLGFGREYVMHFGVFKPHSHNLFLGMFAEYGTLGGLAFLFLVGVNLLKCTHLFFLLQNKKGIFDSFLLGLPIILLTGLFDEPIFSPQIGLLAVILLACWDRYTNRIHFAIDFPVLQNKPISRYSTLLRIAILLYAIPNYLKTKVENNKINN